MDDGRDLEAVYREQGRRLWRSVFAYTGGSREIADDAVAEAFARALATPERIREPVPWLYRVAFRIAAKELKERSMRGADTVAVKSADAPDDGLGDVLGALRRLSPAQRAAVYLHYQADLPVAEVASRLGMSAGSVKVHLYRGRRRLRSLLEDDADA